MDTLIVKVETDEGVTGWGEGFGLSTCATTGAALRNLVVPLALGRDAGDIAGLMNDLQHKLHNCARNGPVGFALSGLDIALWDIAGKVAGKPLYRMLGGEVAERMPTYASLLRYGTSELVARNATEARERGYTRIKLHEITVPEVEAARRAIGPDIPLMVDTNCPWTPDEAVAMAKRMAPFDPLWIEEPVWPPEDYRGLARVRREGGVPVAAGECAGTLADFTQLIDVAQVDYLQPSVTKIGGISEMQKVIALAQARGVKVAPHSPYFGPGLVASVHICAALPDKPPVERFYCDLEASPFGDLVNAPGGSMQVPGGPGLGLVVDEAVIARYRVS
jgi:L-alanine-DL-glutamate epimerase-like enolase superfamily enzyme